MKTIPDTIISNRLRHLIGLDKYRSRQHEAILAGEVIRRGRVAVVIVGEGGEDAWYKAVGIFSATNELLKMIGSNAEAKLTITSRRYTIELEAPQ